ncbi:type III-A CRISPR-associated RAMP protein Csm3 [Saprospira grandis]|uniref:CRISPR system Cms endoribonuclease Csm3 n=1 Tax=Saprospira grandis (strain Lewin) TaxID=984262 RepID=H6L655_SAPGL|nr:type III-A CRISPR-associated RAMP protein Csm3 [Saprospira grandis]AFC22956.1 CRISPR-associated RAMP Csm3 family protein [Saprospira grandis str. Lewin]
MTYKIKEKQVLKGSIILLTGLHIGGTNNSLSIGGVDNSVVRHPVNNQPYIPGSSLKGKLRSLLELAMGQIGNTSMGKVKNGPSENSENISVKLFGNANGERSQIPSRVLVRDAYLDEDSIDELDQTEALFAEIKTEVVIDRITSAAMPRQLERVPAGAKFNFEMVLNIHEGDEISSVHEYELLSNLFAAMALLQDDYLGGHGSRGSGQIKIQLQSITKRSVKFYLGGEEESVDLDALKNKYAVLEQLV